MIDLSVFAAPVNAQRMPNPVMRSMFKDAGCDLRVDPAGKNRAVWYRLPHSPEWRDGGLRSHYKVTHDGEFCAKYEAAQKALYFCLMLAD